MAGHVVVVASGETERRSLSHLASHLRKQGTLVDEVRIPPKNKMLNAAVAEKIIKAVWYEDTDSRPQKIVLLLDLDAKTPEQVVGRMREKLVGRLPEEINARLQYAYAQRHLEAWYFGDAVNLRKVLNRNLGRVDTSKPDEIGNPKLHLKNILGWRTYTSRVSEEIARALDSETIAHRSPSFRNFEQALLNGSAQRTSR